MTIALIDYGAGNLRSAAKAFERMIDETGRAPMVVRSLVDVRYRGQSHETPVAYQPGDGWRTLADHFHRAHQERNGFARPDDPIEIVAARAEATGEPAMRWSDLPEMVPVGEPKRGTRTLLTGEGCQEAAVWWRPGLPAGAEVVGPAVVEEPEATTFLAAGERATVLPSGALEVAW